MSNITDNPTVSPTELETGFPTTAPTEGFVTGGPTTSPTVITTGGPTPSPIEYSLPTTAPPTDLLILNRTRIQIIHLPDYTKKDPVDGIFLGVVVFLMFVSLLICLLNINKRSRR
jgi:hypothetical protein